MYFYEVFGKCDLEVVVHEFLKLAVDSPDINVTEEVFRRAIKILNEIYEQMNEEDSHFYGGGKIVGCILEEFDDLLKKYSLWYEPGFSWSLTTYRI